jgi:hypothetical protein
MIPSRRELTTEFLQKTKVKLFDISMADNNMRTMKKVRYQNHVRKLFLENQQTQSKAENNDSKKNEEIKLLHADWACKVSDIRLKFLPDFETLKKPGFGFISKFGLIFELCNIILLLFSLKRVTFGRISR